VILTSQLFAGVENTDNMEAIIQDLLRHLNGIDSGDDDDDNNDDGGESNGSQMES
jgi:hypothetical protein